MRTSMLSFFLFCALFMLNAQTTTYYNAKNKKVKSLEKSDFYIVLADDSTHKSRNIERQYNKAGQLVSEQRFFLKDNNVKQFDGLSRKWYGNGQLQLETNYSEGKRVGAQTRYKEDGTIFHKVEFADGEIIPSQPKSEYILEHVAQMPEFPGGDKELDKLIMSRIKYPIYPFSNNIQGRIFVSMVINKSGQIEDAYIMKSSNNVELDDEALRVIYTLPAFKPGSQNGFVVAVRYIIPVTFKLNN